MPALKKHSTSFQSFTKQAAVAVCLALSPLTPAIAQQPKTAADQITDQYNAGMKAFAAGDYAGAISNMEAVLPKIPPEQPTDGVLFVLGASYFNTQNYSKSVEIMKSFETKYPKHARIIEVIFSIAQSSMLNNDYATAVEYFKKLEPIPEYRDLSLYYQGVSFKAADKPDEAIDAFVKLITPEIRSSNGATAAILLVGLYAKKHDFTKATDIIKQLRKKMDFVDNIMRLNSQAIALGDGLMEDELPKEALLCYRLVRGRDEVIAFQTDRIAKMNRQIEANLALLRAEPPKAPRLNAENTQLKAAVAEGTKMLEEFKTTPDIKPAVLLRVGRCFYMLEMRWEACVAYDELIQKYPDSKEYEPALFGAAVAAAESNRAEKTKEYSETYLKKFPDGPNKYAVGYLMGVSAEQAKDYLGAATYYGKILKEQPQSTYREEMEMQVGNAYFSAGKFDEAAKDYEKYKTDFPSGKHIEEAIYRLALTSVFSGKYEDAMTRLNDYIAAYPKEKATFLADARYRLGVCKYAAQLFQDVVNDCIAWEKDYPKNPMLGEVLALRADSLDALDKSSEAVQVYIRACQLANTDEVLEYSLSSAGKILQKQGDWEQLSKMYGDFIKQRPEHPLVVTAIYWYIKAMVHEGKTDEAKKKTAETIQKYIDDPKREAVEMLLNQLAALCAKKKKPPEPTPAPVAVATNATSGSTAVATPVPTPTPTPVPTPEEPPADPGVEMEALLGKATDDMSPTARARILYAKAQLAFMRKQYPEQEKNIKEIAEKFKPEELSPVILGQAGDYLLSQKQFDKATPFYQYLLDEYPKSDVVDFAYNGLAEIAFQKKDYEGALKGFTDAIDKGAAAQKLKDVTIGKAKTLFEMDRLDDARKTFEGIASIREWRGESTAYSVYMIGQTYDKQSKFAEANANYQRVYVAYQRFYPWVAKAYLKSGQLFEKLGKKEEAIKTYKEMVANEKLTKFPEFDAARQRLEELK